MKIEILFFLSNLKGGGAQRTVVNILKYLDRDNFSSKLVLLNYSDKQPYASLVPKDVEIVNLDSRGRYSIFKIAKLINDEKPDICFATLPQVCKAVTLGHKISGSNSKVIYRETNYRKKKDMNFLSYKLLKTTYNYSDHNVSLTKGIKKQIIKNYKLSSDKITNIYNPVDLEDIKNEITKNNKFDKNYFNIISCGRLSKQKNFELLIKAAKIIQDERYDDIKIHIMGKGYLEDKLLKLTNRLNVSNIINFLGFQKNPYQYMASADLFVLSSLWEGFGHVIVESMASGTPVLSTDCPYGPREILGNNEYGWLISNDNAEAMADKIIKLHDNPREITNKKDMLNDRVEKFDASYIVKQYEELFYKIFGF